MKKKHKDIVVKILITVILKVQHLKEPKKGYNFRMKILLLLFIIKLA